MKHESFTNLNIKKAAKHNNLTEAEFSIQNDTNVNNVGPYNSYLTQLIICLILISNFIIKIYCFLFILAGSDVNHQDDYGETALMWGIKIILKNI